MAGHNSKPLQGTAADTWKATNAFEDDIGAFYRNESAPAQTKYDDSIILESATTRKEQRKMADKKKRTKSFLDNFDNTFDGQPEAAKAKAKAKAKVKVKVSRAKTA